jgi:hypothetical protein
MNKPEFRASDVQFGLRLSYCKKIFTDPFDYFIPSDGSEVWYLMYISFSQFTYTEITLMLIMIFNSTEIINTRSRDTRLHYLPSTESNTQQYRVDS